MKAKNKTRHIILCIGLAVFFLGTAIPAGVSHAQTRVKGEWVLPKYYPDGFDGWGRIDSIESNKLVIDDTGLKLSPSVTYRTPTKKYATSAYFSPGDLVGFLLDSKGEIISLWLIKK